jgi:hypothetical protein
VSFWSSHQVVVVAFINSSWAISYVSPPAECMLGLIAWRTTCLHDEPLPLLDVSTGRSAMGVALMLRWPRFTGETHNNRLLELNKERDERVMNKTSTLKFTQSELCSPPKGPQSQHQEIIIGNQKYAAGPARRLLGCHLYIYTPFALQVLIGWGLSTLSSCKVSNWNLPLTLFSHVVTPRSSSPASQTFEPLEGIGVDRITG